MSFLNSRKVSWIIFGITLLTAVVSLFFLPDIIPVHFGILGTPDGWDYKMGILLFPIFPFVFDRQEKSKRFYVSFCSDSAE